MSIHSRAERRESSPREPNPTCASGGEPLVEPRLSSRNEHGAADLAAPRRTSNKRLDALRQRLFEHHVYPIVRRVEGLAWKGARRTVHIHPVATCSRV